MHLCTGRLPEDEPPLSKKWGSAMHSRSFLFVLFLLSGLVAQTATADQPGSLSASARFRQSILEAEHSIIRGEYSNALGTLRRISEDEESQGIPWARGTAMLRSAEVLQILGSYVDAMRITRGVLTLASDKGLDELKCHALARIGGIYRFFGQMDKADDHLRQSLDLIKNGKIKRGVGFVLNEMGLLKLEQGMYRDAEDRFKRAAMASMEEADPMEEANALRSLGVLYMRSGQHDLARVRLTDALRISDQAKDKRGTALSLNEMGLMMGFGGHYDQAMKSLNEAMAVFNEIGDIHSSARCLSYIASTCRDLGLTAEALKYFKMAVDTNRKIAFAKGEADCAINIGLILRRLRDHEAAQEYFTMAQDASKKCGDTVGEAYALVYTSEGMYTIFRNYNQPIEFLNQAIQKFSKVGDILGQARAQLAMAGINNEIGRFAEAYDIFHKVCTTVEEIGHPDLLWQAHRGQAFALWKKNKKEAAAKSYAKAIEVIEKLYEGTEDLESTVRGSFIGGKRALYEEFVDLLVELEYEDPKTDYEQQAFRITELAKSRQFSEMLARSGANLVIAEEDPGFRVLLDKERNISLNIARIRQTLYNIHITPVAQRDENRLRSLKTELQEQEEKQKQLRVEMTARFPRYADLRSPRIVKTKEVQDLLKSNEALVSYFVTKNQVVAFVINPKAVHMIPLFPDRKEARNLIWKLRSGFARLESLESLLEWNPDVPLKLYKEIFKEVEKVLVPDSTVFIAGDDALYTIPFEALVRGYDQKAFAAMREQTMQKAMPYFSEYSLLDYLGDHFNFSYIPSAGVLRSLRVLGKRSGATWKENLMAFADPQFSASEKKDGSVPEGSRRMWRELKISTGISGIARLPETAEEASSVAFILGGKHRIYLRDKANEATLYKQNCSQTRYILFSTHGMLGGDFQNIAEPALVLSLVNNPPGYDGFLTMSEVLGLKLNADLVALSACNTAGEAREARNGEGFSGLTRSFMYAGARTLVVSHWPVMSLSTVEFMKGFFANLKSGMTKPQAMRASQKNLRKVVRDSVQYAHPYFWSPFVLVGETN